jgi:PKD repeat protein
MKKLNYLLFGIMSMQLITSCVKEPTADFTFSTPTEVGETILFTNLSTNSENYSWDFGDGNYSTIESPTHVYEKPGTYTVSLNVTGKGGSALISKTISITGITYSIQNNSSFTLTDFCSYYWTGSEIQDFIYHGTLYSGQKTEIVITNRTQIYYGFTYLGVTYIGAYPFNLIINQHNDLVFTDYTPIYGGSKNTKNLIISLDVEEQFINFQLKIKR